MLKNLAEVASFMEREWLAMGLLLVDSKGRCVGEVTLEKGVFW